MNGNQSKDNMNFVPCVMKFTKKANKNIPISANTRSYPDLPATIAIA